MAAVIERFTQDPDARLDYSIDWSAWLVGTDEIATSSWAVAPTGPTLSDSSLSVSKKVTTVFFAGGAVGERFVLTNSIITTGGREDDRSISIRIAER